MSKKQDFEIFYNQSVFQGSPDRLEGSTTLAAGRKLAAGLVATGAATSAVFCYYDASGDLVEEKFSDGLT